MTLLQMVQDILYDMDSFEVDSIADVVEARQVASIIQSTYYNIITRANLPEHQKIFSLTASGDDDLPILMYRPDSVAKIDWIQYNTSEDTELDYNYVTIVPLEQFISLTKFNTEDDDVNTCTIDGQTYLFKTADAPKYCTILKNYYILFDAYNSAVDTTLQASKTKCFGLTIPDFDLTDSFIPDLDDTQFPLLLNEAKSTAFLRMKQMVDNSSVRESKRQWNTLSGGKNVNKGSTDFDLLPTFGRK